MTKKHIEECVRDNLESYFKDLRGVEPSGLYEMILGLVEKPLLDAVNAARRCGFGRRPAARATKRTRLQLALLTS